MPLHRIHVLSDDTFAWAKISKTFSQQYNLIWKITDEIEDKVFTHNVCSVLLKDGKKPTYKHMLDVLDSIYLRFGVKRTDRIIPLSLRVDHEKAIISEASKRWSDDRCLIVSCQFHFLKNVKDRLKKIDKFYFKSQSPCYKAWKVIQGLPYAPFNRDIEDGRKLLQVFRDRFNADFIAPNLNQIKKTEFNDFAEYIVKEYVDHQGHGFARGNHYLFYKIHESDLTSNSVEVHNREFKRGAHSCCLVDYCHYIIQKK